MKSVYIDTPIGILELSFDDEFNVIKIAKSDRFLLINEQNLSTEIMNFIECLKAYFEDKTITIDYPFKLINASNFCKAVFNLTSQISYGETVSYNWIAKKLNTSPRAVGQALKKNPLPLIIPCHRVIKTNGDIGGYSLGIEVKKWLLEHEKSTLYKLLLHKI
ncbi:MAG: methylated-DNA--[protein]-cysteine S-methyltransferase [Thermodesulfovibrio sp.]|uniref:methylated-DNA--[protein]-cysteine S-methyltransferase n=1 Tax=unclassified Thermodesulfovibrio TaxID=2645936 RepID=UPI00083A13C9|nr:MULTISPECIES: methylated-DNA--[protein]-cysteine S-methyltransferase [unclassified Thermodesulfovibrio]MDI1472205.1 methylated-DNA--[protein]-cysteine S-methyltransferase [Thermodesulfovibrio sp. 1176]MDI6714068.1 methylated-DNA--[protein]-cysteine S-methyltransferase [Thermodesulfovibrio sp.]ODA43857.1 Methylated-DNA--protein-cysteine methyltransferase [Thermodesulfovibrio sp. N1]